MNAVSVPSWHDLAACQYTDAEIFFPEGDEMFGAAAVIAADGARGVCILSCPVRRECLSHALRKEPYGIWGGLTERERLAERTRRRPRTVDEIFEDYGERYRQREARRIAAQEDREEREFAA